MGPTVTKVAEKRPKWAQKATKTGPQATKMGPKALMLRGVGGPPAAPLLFFVSVKR